MAYRLIDHTADFGLQVFAKDPGGLFAEAARAMFEQIVESPDPAASEPRVLRVDGADWPDLMVNWLRELLYCWAGRGLLVRTVDIMAISQTRLSAHVWTARFDPRRHPVKHEIKAVTYHQISVGPGPAGWEAKIIFDV